MSEHTKDQAHGHIPASDIERQGPLTSHKEGHRTASTQCHESSLKNMGQPTMPESQENLENLPAAVSSGRALRARTGQRAVAARKRAKAQKAFLVLYGQCGVIGQPAHTVQACAVTRPEAECRVPHHAFMPYVSITYSTCARCMPAGR